MFLKWFNKSFEGEKDRTRDRLVELLEKEVKSIKTSISSMPMDRIAEKEELHKLMASLLVRKALAEFEAEEIVKRRIDMRAAFLALLMSSLSLIISVYTLMKS